MTVKHPAQPELSLHITTPGPPLDDGLADAIRTSLAAGTMTGAIATSQCERVQMAGNVI